MSKGIDILSDYKRIKKGFNFLKNLQNTQLLGKIYCKITQLKKKIKREIETHCN